DSQSTRLRSPAFPSGFSESLAVLIGNCQRPHSVPFSARIGLPIPDAYVPVPKAGSHWRFAMERMRAGTRLLTHDTVRTPQLPKSPKGRFFPKFSARSAPYRVYRRDRLDGSWSRKFNPGMKLVSRIGWQVCGSWLR